MKAKSKANSTAALEQEQVLPADEPDGAEVDGSDEQPIIEVSQDEIKSALRALLERESELMGMLYGAFDEYNQEFFAGLLSIPLITVEKLSARTLGNYTYGKNNIPVKNHIRLNRDFVALNTMERVLETLRHEMIHQWQDEVIYAPDGSDEYKTYKQAVMDETGKIEFIDAMQKKRPKDWHNVDFKEMARVVGIPANGPKCTGNPAKMRETKSYNRKFRCQCPTSNNYPVTIWSTREIHAICRDCGQPFVEVPKNNPATVTIEVKTSHVEQPGQDAVQEQMLQKYAFFERFSSKKERDAFIARIPAGRKKSEKGMEQGVYQKGHNAYNAPAAYRYWVAFNAPVKPVAPPAEPQPQTPAPQPPAPPVEAEADKPKLKPKATPKEKKPRVWDADKAQDILDAYLETGSLKGAAAIFGITQAAYRSKAQELKVDFKTGTIGA